MDTFKPNICSWSGNLDGSLADLCRTPTDIPAWVWCKRQTRKSFWRPLDKMSCFSILTSNRWLWTVYIRLLVWRCLEGTFTSFRLNNLHVQAVSIVVLLLYQLNQSAECEAALRACPAWCGDHRPIQGWGFSVCCSPRDRWWTGCGFAGSSCDVHWGEALPCVLANQAGLATASDERKSKPTRHWMNTVALTHGSTLLLSPSSRIPSPQWFLWFHGPGIDVPRWSSLDVFTWTATSDMRADITCRSWRASWDESSRTVVHLWHSQCMG